MLPAYIINHNKNKISGGNNDHLRCRFIISVYGTGSLHREILGVVIGVQANVGGVGIAMLLLVLACSHPMFKSLTEGASGTGIKFWSAMYIPIVVAMAARQNVVAAVDGGMLALLAGALAVIVSFALVPVLSRIGTKVNLFPHLMKVIKEKVNGHNDRSS